MKNILLILSFLYCNASVSQLFPKTYGDTNTINYGQIFESPNGNILITNYTQNVDDTVSYSKLIFTNNDGEVIKERNYDRFIADILFYSPDSIFLLYKKTSEAGMVYLFCELIDNDFNSKHLDSTFILQTDYKTINFRTKLTLFQNNIFFYTSTHILGAQNSTLTIGSIDLNGSFAYNTKNLVAPTIGFSDFLIKNKNEFYLFYNYSYVYKLDSSFQQTDLFQINTDLYSDLNAFWLSENTFIVGGTSFENQLLVTEVDVRIKKDINNIIYESDYDYNRAGYFSSVVKFDTCFCFIGTKNLKALGPYNSEYSTKIFMVGMNYNFEVLWEKEFGGDAFYIVYSVCGTKNNECLVLSSKYNPADENEGDELYLLKVNKYGNIVTSTPIIKTEQKALVYPNPGINTMNFKLPENYQNANINLYNISGKKVLSNKVNTNRFSISTSHLPKGVYIYEITDNKNHRIQGKWVKQ